MVGGGLDSHAPRNLTHRRKQRQPPIRGLHGLIRDRVNAPVEEELGEPAVGRQVQIGEQVLPGAESVIFLSDWLLDFDDQVRSGEHVVRGAENPSASRDVLVVGKSAARSGACLHHDLPAVIGQLGNAIGLHRHPTFLVLDLLRHTNHQRGHNPFSLVLAPPQLAPRATLRGGAASSASGRPSSNRQCSAWHSCQDAEMEIRDVVDSDWAAIWGFLQQIVAAGDTYCWPPDTSEARGTSVVDGQARRPGARRR